MRPDDLRALLEGVRQGRTAVDDAVQRLRDLPFADLGYATLDHHRELRCGVPEVIFGAGKDAGQIVGILEAIAERDQSALATRVPPEVAEEVRRALPHVEHHPRARALVLRGRASVVPTRGVIGLITAGTSDLPIAEEAALTCQLFGHEVERHHDVGVAGIHRLLARRERLEAATVNIVVAGMEGALPSVVAGLTSKPVIAVPTSVGYGAALGGMAALLGMLTSCGSGVTVVNIDNGFGAAYAACLINRGEPT